MICKIDLLGKEYEYELTRKRVRNLNLRIKPDCSICVSAPMRLPQSEIERFLKEKSFFIINALKKCETASKLSPKPLTYCDGERLSILGEYKTICVYYSKYNHITIDGDTINIFVPDTNSFKQKSTLIENYKKTLCINIVTQMCKDVYPKFSKYVKAFPELKFRKMTSKWGCCRPTLNILTFNTALSELPKELIEYVVFHEFTHFLQANHSARFYQQLSVFLPDWSVRKKALSSYRLVR